MNSVASQTQRKAHFSNKHVKVWGTIIYPNEQQQLPMHHHQYDRVVVALNNGELKVVNNKKQSHLLKLKKGKSYFLPKDVKNETHVDINIGKKPLKVVVIELLQS